MMEFKQLNLTGLEALSDIFGEAQHAFFDPGQPDHHVWAKEMAARHIGRGTLFWAGFVAEEPVGLIGLLHDKQPNGKDREFAEITHVGVGRSCRKTGYGSSLLEHVESVARFRGVIILEVETNTSTMPFYEKNGYIINAKPRFGEMVRLFKKLQET